MNDRIVIIDNDAYWSVLKINIISRRPTIISREVLNVKSIERAILLTTIKKILFGCSHITFVLNPKDYVTYFSNQENQDKRRSYRSRNEKGILKSLNKNPFYHAVITEAYKDSNKNIFIHHKRVLEKCRLINENFFVSRLVTRCDCVWSSFLDRDDLVKAVKGAHNYLVINADHESMRVLIIEREKIIFSHKLWIVDKSDVVQSFNDLYKGSLYWLRRNNILLNKRVVIADTSMIDLKDVVLKLNKDNKNFDQVLLDSKRDNSDVVFINVNEDIEQITSKGLSTKRKMIANLQVSEIIKPYQSLLYEKSVARLCLIVISLVLLSTMTLLFLTSAQDQRLTHLNEQEEERYTRLIEKKQRIDVYDQLVQDLPDQRDIFTIIQSLSSRLPESVYMLSFNAHINDGVVLKYEYDKVHRGQFVKDLDKWVKDQKLNIANSSIDENGAWLRNTTNAKWVKYEG